MTRTEQACVRLLSQLAANPGARLIAGEGGYAISGGQMPGPLLSKRVVRALVASGLLVEAEPGRIAAGALVAGWLKRRATPDLAFRAQHDALGLVRTEDGAERLANLEESPVAALARRTGKSGEAWLSAVAVTAAERLRRDFEIGQLQPRVTANWSASVNSGRRSDGAGMADLTDMAVAARRRFDRAMQGVGPELCGVLVDVCCFLKGLETVEREHLWPARSAKLVLRLALATLSRHYGLAAETSGRPGAETRHWGTDDYRPEIS